MNESRRLMSLLPVFRPECSGRGSSGSRGRSSSPECRHVRRMDRQRTGRDLGGEPPRQQRVADGRRRQSSDHRKSGLARNRRRDGQRPGADVGLEELKRRRDGGLRTGDGGRE